VHTLRSVERKSGEEGDWNSRITMLNFSFLIICTYPSTTSLLPAMGRRSSSLCARSTPGARHPGDGGVTMGNVVDLVAKADWRARTSCIVGGKRSEVEAQRVVRNWWC
jgi:hypothetical protein